MVKKAFFTLVRNEKIFLPILLKYYSKFFSQKDIFVLSHNTTDKSTEGLSCNVIPISHPYVSHEWMHKTCSDFQKNLLEYYDVVVFAEADEIIFHKDGLDQFIENLNEPSARCNGFNIHQHESEPEFDPTKSVLSQRKYCLPADMFCKTLISKVPVEWDKGFHHSLNLDSKITPNLFLFHLHYLDQGISFERVKQRQAMLWEQTDIENHWGEQWWIKPTDWEWKRDMLLIPKEIRESEAF